MARTKPPKIESLPEAPIAPWIAPLQRFLGVEASSGLVLSAATVLALVLANSAASEWFLSLWHTPCRIAIGGVGLEKELLHVINDGLMAIFFFVVGLEIKRELVAGELRDPRKAALPIFAAIGGMVAPALLFVLLSAMLDVESSARRAWAVPMATDIAFVVGVMALFGRRVPLGLKILVLSLAIVDDLGAVLVIALVFTEQIHWGSLGLAGAGLALTYALNRLGVRRVSVYIAVGAGVWLAVLKSGVHPTVAGVALGLLTPASAWIGDKALLDVLEDLFTKMRGGAERPAPAVMKASLGQASFATREAVSPLERLENDLHPWVAFLIMPVFALANAGVVIEPAAAKDPVALAIALSLAAGKPIGIIGACWLAVRAGAARLPAGVSWGMLAAGGCLAGIGFTMALFLASLSLPAASLDAGKIGTLMGSVASAALGIVLLWLAVRRK